MPLPIYGAKKEEKPPLSTIRYTVAVAAGKGGVGKSTCTVNLARALKQMGYRVGVMDSDLYGPSIRKMMPEERGVAQGKEALIPAESGGIKTISMAYFRSEKEAAAIRAPIANGIIGQFLEQVEWGELDILLIDFPPGTGDIQLTLAQKAHLSGAIMVTTPQQVAVMDVKKAIDLFRVTQVPVLGIIENMSFYEEAGKRHYLFGKEGGKRLAEEGQLPFLGEIPIDAALSESGDSGESLFGRTPPHPVEQVWMGIAKVLVQGLAKEEESADFEVEWRDEQRFTIKWKDGVMHNYFLPALQQECPCAGCHELRQQGKERTDPSVKAKRLYPIGRYALRILFTSGCSSGIYDYSLLRRIGMVG